MKDVFISFSTIDIDICKSVCRWLESNGLSYWVYFEHKSDNYQKKIYEGIKNCKHCILLMSDNSINSPDVIQELGVVRNDENKKRGMNLFHVYIGEIKDKEKEKSELSYTTSIRDSYNWFDESDKKKLFENIAKELNTSITRKIAGNINSNTPIAVNLAARGKDLTKIEEKINEHKKVYITAVKGQGKTELLKAVCNKCKDNFDKIIFFGDEISIVNTIANDNKIISHRELPQKERELSPYELCHFKLSLLENYINRREEKILLVIDDCENERLLDRIGGFNCNVLISINSNRIQKFNSYLQKWGFYEYTIKNVDDDDLIKTFKYYIPETLSTNDKKKIKEHNLGALSISDICLIAEQMKYYNNMPHFYRRKEDILKERVKNIRHIISSHHISQYVSNQYNKYKNKLDKLNKKERGLLKAIFLIPIDGMSKVDFYELLQKKMDLENPMVDISDWIQEDDGKITLPLVVRDVIADELTVHIDDPDIKDFIENFFKKIVNFDNNSYEENQKLKGLALSIYSIFPDPEIYKYKEYLLLSKFLSSINCLEESLEIQDKVTKLFPLVDKAHAKNNPAETAETYFQIGLTYDIDGNYLKAIEMLKNAIALYANRYAAALSHLANTLLHQGDKNLNEIEPYYKESLELRCKYAKDTMSEAISCHLYSKGLSELSNNKKQLLHAQDLSKRAHDLVVERRMPNVHKSSIVYNHNWVKIKVLSKSKRTEANKKVIRNLISEIERAKNARVEGRGEFHNWMEDIYLKLGLSYKIIDDYSTALGYFKKLKIIRERKYKDNKSHKRLVELYSILRSIYNKLGDANNAEYCSQYLKTNCQKRNYV